MKNKLFVFDTNTLISALIFKNSIPAKAFKKALVIGRILLSNEVFDEITEVLYRDKFRKYFSVQKAELFILLLHQEAVFIEDTKKPINVCRDPKDNKFLELAIAAEAECIVSSDKDLQILNPFQGIPILPPKQFLIKTTPEK